MSEHISVNQDTILRGADHQQTTRRTRNLLYEGPTMRQVANLANQAQFGGTASLLPQNDAQTDWAQPGIRLQAFELHNRANAAIAVGIGFRMRNGVWQAGDYDDSDTGNQYARNRDLQGRTGVTLAIGGADDGFAIFSRRKWNWLSINVTTATNDAAENGTIAVSYTDEAGSAWITVSADQAIQDTITLDVSTELTVGEHVFVWNPPHDWGKTNALQSGSAELDASFPVGHYGFRITQPVLPDDVAAIITGMEIGFLKTSGEELADNGLFENEQMSWVEFDADGVVAYFETAAAGNMVDFECAPAG